MEGKMREDERGRGWEGGWREGRGREERGVREGR